MKSEEAELNRLNWSDVSLTINCGAIKQRKLFIQSCCNSLQNTLILIDIPFLGVLRGEVRGEESNDEAFDWLSSVSFLCLSRPSSERKKPFYNNWWFNLNTTKTLSHQQRAPWCHLNLLCYQLCIKKTYILTILFASCFLATGISILVLRSGASLADGRSIRSSPLTGAL